MADLGCVDIEYFAGMYNRGDLVRQMCVAGKVAFKDCDVDPAEWPAKKADKAMYPNGGLPVACIGGCRMVETMAITRFLAIKCGWFPADAKCAWAADTCMDMWTDTMNAMGGFLFAPEDGKAAALEKLLGCVDSFLCVAAERMAAMKWKFAAGNSCSVGDVAIFTLWANTANNDMCPLKQQMCDIYAKYPCLKTGLDCLLTKNEVHLKSRACYPF